MTNTIRFGGAQIPCTTDIKKNVKTIKTAIDWATDNKLDYLVTPEASLSGYSINFNKDLELLEYSLKEIEDYARDKQVGLCLGTLWLEPGDPQSEKPYVKRNQIRYYSKDGRIVGVNNKWVLTPLDVEIGIEKSETLTSTYLPFDNTFIHTAGVICADLYGYQSNKGGLAGQFVNYLGTKLLIHSTNPERGNDSFRDEIEDIWLEANIRRISYYMCPVIVADNCYKMDGTEYYGQTATQSGICLFGKWVTNVPRTGTQYFYYDIPIDNLIIQK